MDFVIICRKALYFRGSLSIYPAYAGMIPDRRPSKLEEAHLSRVCGDDPDNELTIQDVDKFVPRMRG